jgi:hypothetical protein
MSDDSEFGPITEAELDAARVNLRAPSPEPQSQPDDPAMPDLVSGYLRSMAERGPIWNDIEPVTLMEEADAWLHQMRNPHEHASHMLDAAMRLLKQIVGSRPLLRATLTLQEARAVRSEEPEAPDEDEVERVAKAIWDAGGFGVTANNLFADRDNEFWVEAANEYRGYARAALRALAARPRGEPKPDLPPVAYGDMVSQGVSPHPANEPPPLDSAPPTT